jgi:hypothetical protein
LLKLYNVRERLISMEHWWNNANWGKPTPVSHRPTQIPHGLALD